MAVTQEGGGLEESQVYLNVWGADGLTRGCCRPEDPSQKEGFPTGGGRHRPGVRPTEYHVVC